jgi:hypothetical protein
MLNRAALDVRSAGACPPDDSDPARNKPKPKMPNRIGFRFMLRKTDDGHEGRFYPIRDERPMIACLYPWAALP